MLHRKNLQPLTGAVFVICLQLLDSPQENPCRYGGGASESFNLRFAGQYADSESNLFQNGFRSYAPALGRYSQSDPIGLGGGWSRFGYVEGNALSSSDAFGLHKGDKWYGFNNREFQRWFHQCWKQPGNPDADQDEIAEAYDDWISRGSPTGGKCDNTPPPPPIVVPPPADQCNDTCEAGVKTVIVGGAAYFIYRCARMLPSLVPPLWWTIPGNAVIP